MIQIPATLTQTLPSLVSVISPSGVVAELMRVHGAMTMANTSVSGDVPVTDPADDAYTMYAPTIMQDFNGWSTSINVGNDTATTADVSVDVLSADGKSISSHTFSLVLGVQTVNMPAIVDLGLGIGDFTSAVITSNIPITATIDAVKSSTGSAFSYNATTALASATTPSTNTVSLPLFQKGQGAGGDNSEIAIFNPDSTTFAVGTVHFYASDGTNVDPGAPFVVAPLARALIYAPSLANITPGSQLSAVITVNAGRVTGVSTVANNDAPGGGYVAYNLADSAGQTRASLQAPKITSPALLSVTLSAPTALTLASGKYAPNPFTVTAMVANYGNDDARNVTASITLPAGLTLASGSAVQSIGDLGSGASTQVVWDVKAASQTSNTALGYLVEAQADNAPMAPAIAQMTVPAIGATLCVLSNQNQLHQAGSTVVIKVAVCDPTTGADLSTSSMNVVASGLTDAAGTSYPAAHPGNSFPGNVFKFDPSLSTSGGFQFNLKTTGLPSGAYELEVTVDGVPTTNSVTVIIR